MSANREACGALTAAMFSLCSGGEAPFVDKRCALPLVLPPKNFSRACALPCPRPAAP